MSPGDTLVVDGHAFRYKIHQGTAGLSGVYVNHDPETNDTWDDVYLAAGWPMVNMVVIVAAYAQVIASLDARLDQLAEGWVHYPIADFLESREPLLQALKQALGLLVGEEHGSIDRYPTSVNKLAS